MRRIMFGLTLAALLLSAVFVFGQSSTANPGLKITVANQTCGLILAGESEATPEAEATSQADATPEATAEPAHPRLILGGDCFEVTPHLYVASNDVLWIALGLPNEPTWQRFSTDPADGNPPQLDKRGRFVGCSIPLEGTQVCRVLWENFGTTYAVEIPVTVGKAYTAPPTSIPVSTEAPVPISTPNNAGVWGSCGSCTTCGGPVEHCVLAPDNSCVWDAFRCERPNPK